MTLDQASSGHDDPATQYQNKLWDDAYTDLYKRDKSVVTDYEGLVMEEYRKMTEGNTTGMYNHSWENLPSYHG